jgi:hypothetical protein
MYQSMVTFSVRLVLKDLKIDYESTIKMVVLTLNMFKMQILESNIFVN